MSDRGWVRYTPAFLFLMFATLVTGSRPALMDSPHLVYLAAVVLSAICGGLGPAVLTTALSVLLIRYLFLYPQFDLHFGNDAAGKERMGVFVLVAMMLGSLVSSIRREKHVLRDSEERYRILAETVSDAIVVVDEREEIVFVNPVAEKIFGDKTENLLGRNLSTLLPDKTYQSHLRNLRDHLDTRKKAVALQLPGLHLESGRRLTLEMTLGSFSKHGRNLFTAVIRDITGLRQRPEPKHL